MFNAKQKKFPSSIGELHFSMEPQGLLAQLVEQFPSPIGELHFSIEKDYDDPEAYECKVSVPCRGTTFLNTIPTIPPPVWAHGRDCVGKIFLEK